MTKTTKAAAAKERKYAKLDAFDVVLDHLNANLMDIETDRLLLQSTIYKMVQERAAVQKAKAI